MSTTPRRIGKYELRKLLGSGSLGEVWQAHDLHFRRDVAIKLFSTALQSDPNFTNRLLSQGQSLASLHHPNIVRIFDANMALSEEANSTIAYRVMELIEGPTLADSIRNTSRRGAFPAVSDIVSLFTQLGAAIDYAHEHGIIHGNIKPANILFNRHFSTMSQMGKPMLTDFGIARPTNSSARNSALYISPEQAKGLPATRHSDIYSLGILLYEICTGVPPFRSENPVVLRMQHLNMQPISPTLININIPSELSTVILRALAKDSATCFSSASQMAKALADACSIPTTLNKPTIEARQPSYSLMRREPVSTPRTVSVIPYVPVALPAQKRAIPATTLTPTPMANTSAWAMINGPLRFSYKDENLPVALNAPNRATRRVPTPLEAASNSTGESPYNPSTSTWAGTGASIGPEKSLASVRRAFSSGERELETPPALAVIPSSRVSAPLSQTSSVRSPLSLPPPRKVKKLASIYLWLALTLLLVIIGSVLGMLSWLHSQPATSSHAAVGHILFQGDSSGQNDVLRIELKNIPAPPPGKSYYAWLVIDTQENSPTPTLLGKLLVSSGQVTFLYPGDAHHSDLLASVSGLLITVEDANGTPSFPSSTMVYTVDFTSITHPSVLDSVRGLLSNEQDLNKLGVSGGLATWLLRDTSKTWLWASNARDYWQGTSTDSKALNFIRGQIVHIVDVLEGRQLDIRDAPIARIALLQSNDQAPNYLDATFSRLNTIASAKYAATDSKARAITISKDLQHVKNWLQGVHQDAIQLLAMNDQQFIQPQAQSLLDDMVAQANNAYNGQIDLSANPPQHAGMAQIYSDIQRLATFDVVPFKES